MHLQDKSHVSFIFVIQTLADTSFPLFFSLFLTMRQHIASDFRLKENKHPFVFKNEKGHVLVIAFITSSVVRVQYLTKFEREQQIKEADCMAGSVDVKLSNTCVDGQLLTDTLELKTSDLRLVITLQPAFQLKWYPLEQQDASEFPFAEDLLYRAYAYDKATNDKWHYQRKYDGNLYYGLGERTGSFNLSGRRFKLERLDCMGYDAETQDPLYKFCPFYICLSRKSRYAYGIHYNNFSKAEINFGQELDAVKKKTISFLFHIWPNSLFVDVEDLHVLSLRVWPFGLLYDIWAKG